MTVKDQLLRMRIDGRLNYKL